MAQFSTSSFISGSASGCLWSNVVRTELACEPGNLVEHGFNKVGYWTAVVALPAMAPSHNPLFLAVVHSRSMTSLNCDTRRMDLGWFHHTSSDYLSSCFLRCLAQWRRVVLVVGKTWFYVCRGPYLQGFSNTIVVAVAERAFCFVLVLCEWRIPAPPGHLTSDRGVQFTSQVWEIMAKALGTKLHCTTAYHPAAYGPDSAPPAPQRQGRWRPWRPIVVDLWI